MYHNCAKKSVLCKRNGVRPTRGQGVKASVMDQAKVIVIGFVALLLASFALINPAGAESIRLAQATGSGRVALLIGNANYPGDDRPPLQPIKDLRAVAEELKRANFEVITGEDVGKPQLRSLLGSFKAKIKPGSTALVFFSGYGVQTNKQSYIIPVDAQIWTEGEVRRDGISVESILADMNAAGAAVKLVIVDAARRNPFERRFRGLSTGLAPLTAPAGTLAIYSAAPDRVVNDSDGANSLFVSELLKEMSSPGLSAESVFNNTQRGVSRNSKGEQVPWVSSSLAEDFYFGKPPAGTLASAPPPSLPPPLPPVSTPSRPAATPPPTQSPALAPPPKPASKPPADEDPAVTELNDAIGRNPRDPDLYYKRGQVLAEQGKYALAAEDFSQAIKLAPHDAEAFNNRCFVRAVTGDLDAALSDCSEAIKLRPKYMDALDSRGLTYLKLGQFDKAVADYDAALQLNPKMASALFGRGKAKLRKGNTSSGDADIRAAKAIDSTIDREFEMYGVR